MSLYQRLIRWEQTATFSRKWTVATLYGLFWLAIITTILGYVPWGQPDKLFVFGGFAMPMVAFFAYLFVKNTHKDNYHEVGKETEQETTC
jgi:hypothetical protein